MIFQGVRSGEAAAPASPIIQSSGLHGSDGHVVTLDLDTYTISLPFAHNAG
jgi:hypothetical protein